MKICYNLVMSVRDYYYEHFNELTPEKQFHFATRMKNFIGVHDFDEWLKNNQPDTDLEAILSNNDYSRVAQIAVRKPFFEKYPKLYGVEATLFRVHHLLKEYSVDTRDEFIKLYPKEKLYRLSDELLSDDEALRALSTWAVNTIFLTEELFPRNQDSKDKLIDWALELDPSLMEPSLYVYLCTHIVICESEFYTKKVEPSEALIKLLSSCKEVVLDNINSVSLDSAIEFLVCCKMIGLNFEDVRSRINEICKSYLKNSPYLINYRRDSDPKGYYHTLNGAEHINSLYIMSELDKINSSK